MVRERTLPGIYFEDHTPEPRAELPRMDIAAFVGLSEKGPEHEPTPIESYEQFERRFGGEVALAWDPQRRETVYAHLPRTVRAFFENGGRQCFVIRVGGVDALQHFNATLFLEEDLKETQGHDLLTRAFYLRYQSPKPREQLRGIHAALELENVTLIAVPDAVHRRAIQKFVHPPPELPKEEPVQHTPTGQFETCDVHSLARPQLEHEPPLSCEDPIRLHWGILSPFEYPENTMFVLEEANRPDFKDAAVVYKGLAHSTRLFARGYGQDDYLFYRVQAQYNDIKSDWSKTTVVQVRTEIGFELEPLNNYNNETLLEVHEALLHMCAARGDLFALLSLPEHFREDKALPYVEDLRKGSRWGSHIRALSYGAVYHPWTIQRITENSKIVQTNNQITASPLSSPIASPLSPSEPSCQTHERSGGFRTTPPDGVVTGLLARRALERGAWIAPANELLKGMVALSPRISTEHYEEWYKSQINLLRQEAKGFTILSSETLADTDKQDLELRSINVRRLLILLRRMALRLGNDLVFEPNNEALRRRAERTLERALDYLFERGAFRPERRNQAYQVVTNSSVNTPQSLDLGRFIVEIKVAPSQPLAFLTVRLVQTGDQGLVVQEA